MEDMVEDMDIMDMDMEIMDTDTPLPMLMDTITAKDLLSPPLLLNLDMAMDMDIYMVNETDMTQKCTYIHNYA